MSDSAKYAASAPARVADLLRQRVRDDRDGRGEPQRGVGEERRRDHDAVAEVVDAVADQDHEPRPALVVQRVVVLALVQPLVVVLVAVAVAPQHHLLEQEEREESGEHHPHDRVGAASLERMRQELEEHGAEQRTDREAHEARDPRGSEREREPGEQRRDDAAGERGDHDGGEGRQGARSIAG
jgi:hypothetical protein